MMFAVASDIHTALICGVTSDSGSSLGDDEPLSLNGADFDSFGVWLGE